MKRGKTNPWNPNDWPEEVKGMIENAYKERSPLPLTVSPNPRDLKTPIVNLGKAYIPIEAAWDQAPLGNTFLMTVKKTKRGRIFFSPVNPKDPATKYDPSTPRIMRGIVCQEKTTGDIFLKTMGGVILLPMDREEWNRRAVGFVGKTTNELVAIPGTTYYLVNPATNFDDLFEERGVAERPDRAAESRKLAGKIDTEQGFIYLETQFGVIRIPAITFLGITLEEIKNEGLTAQLVKKKAKEAMARYHPDKRAETPLGIDPAIYFSTIGEAKKLLLELIKKGWTIDVRLEELLVEVEDAFNGSTETASPEAPVAIKPGRKIPAAKKGCKKKE